VSATSRVALEVHEDPGSTFHWHWPGVTRSASMFVADPSQVPGDGSLGQLHQIPGGSRYGSISAGPYVVTSIGWRVVNCIARDGRGLAVMG
jgi:hypothetical protein